MLNEPLKADDAKKEILRRLKVGTVYTSPHFRRAAAAEGLLPLAAVEFLFAGFVEMVEFEGGNWCYRVRNGRVVVVVAFRGENQLDLVTFIKKR
jgi:hypothetical protein